MLGSFGPKVKATVWIGSPAGTKPGLHTQGGWTSGHVMSVGMSGECYPWDRPKEHSSEQERVIVTDHPLERTVQLERMTSPEVTQACKAAKGVAIIPIGAIEVHGPHLPIGTDSIETYEIGLRAARQAGVVVAPLIWYGNSRSFMDFPGSIGVRPEVLKELVKDIALSSDPPRVRQAGRVGRPRRQLRHSGCTDRGSASGDQGARLPCARLGAGDAAQAGGHAGLRRPRWIVGDLGDAGAVAR